MNLSPDTKVAQKTKSTPPSVLHTKSTIASKTAMGEKFEILTESKTNSIPVFETLDRKVLDTVNSSSKKFILNLFDYLFYISGFLIFIIKITSHNLFSKDF